MKNVIAPPTLTEIVMQVDGGVLAVEGILRRQIEQREDYRRTIKLHKGRLNSLLVNDPDYSNIEETAKEAAKKLKEKKARILNTEEAFQVKHSLKEQQAQLKDLEESINNHFSSFEKTTGQLTLCDIDGTPLIDARKIYKLKKAKSRKE